MGKRRFLTGFVLIELLAVIAIISIIASLVFVSLRGSKDKAWIVALIQFSATVHHKLGAEAIGIWDFDEGVGASSADISGFNNNLTILGAAWVSGDQTPEGKGYALSFDGDDYAAIQNLHYDKVGQIKEFTVCVWFKTSYSGGNWLSNQSFIDFDRSKYFSFFIRGNDGKLSFSTTDETGSTDDLDSDAILNDGQWHFACGVYDGVDKIIYVDAREDVKNSNTHNGRALGNGEVRYGFIGDGSRANVFNGNRTNRYYQGVIDGVYLYEKGLTSAQIKKIYTQELSKHAIIK